MGYPIASRVKSRRDRLGWTEGGLAQRSGVTVERIAEIERAGCMPTVPELVGMGVALGVSCDALVGLKLPATVTVGRTTVTVSTRIEGMFSDDRTVLETTNLCVKAVQAALSPSPPAPPVEVRVPARAYSDLRNEVKAAEAREVGRDRGRQGTNCSR
jgi:transcriptional regulator with XRE-family HTH domain